MQHDTRRISKGRGRRRRARKISNREVSASSSLPPSSFSFAYKRAAEAVKNMGKSGRKKWKKKKKDFFSLLDVGKRWKGRANEWLVCGDTLFPQKKRGGGRKKKFSLISPKGEKKRTGKKKGKVCSSSSLLSPFSPPPLLWYWIQRFQVYLCDFGGHVLNCFSPIESYYKHQKHGSFSRANFPPDFLSISYRGGGGRVGFGDKVHSTPSPTRSVSILYVAIRHNWYLLGNR